jgi:hypothetical protein
MQPSWIRILQDAGLACRGAERHATHLHLGGKVDVVALGTRGGVGGAVAPVGLRYVVTRLPVRPVSLPRPDLSRRRGLIDLAPIAMSLAQENPTSSWVQRSAVPQGLPGGHACGRRRRGGMSTSATDAGVSHAGAVCRPYNFSFDVRNRRYRNDFGGNNSCSTSSITATISTCSRRCQARAST